MIGISKLYCDVVEPSDALRYGRDSSKLPSHLLLFSKDMDEFMNGSTLGVVRAGQFITGSYAPDTKNVNNFLSKLDNIDSWINLDGSINYETHYAYVQVSEKDPTTCQQIEDKYCLGGSLLRCVGEKPKDMTNYTIIYREECETKLVGGLDLGKRAGDMEGMMSELKQENEAKDIIITQMQSSLCKLGEIVWC